MPNQIEDSSVVHGLKGFDTKPDITIFIDRVSETVLNGLLIRNDQYIQFTANIPPQQLKGFSSDLRNEFCNILKRVASGGLGSHEAIENEMAALKDLGATIRDGLFGDARVLQEFDDVVNGTSIANVLLISTDFSLPWELLYWGNESSPTKFNDFLGAKAVITRATMSRTNHPNEIYFKDRPSIGLFPYMQLPSVRDCEVPHFKLLESQDKISLQQWSSPSGSWDQNKSRFQQNWVSGAFDMAHFACHAERGNTPAETCLVVDNRLAIPIYRMKRALKEIGPLEKQPLIIFNACKTGEIDPVSNFGFIDDFIKLGVRGVVATECLVPDRSAHLFTELFYKYFLPSKPKDINKSSCSLGETLHKCRHELWNKYNNPIGLIYSLYAPSGFRLVELQ